MKSSISLIFLTISIVAGHKFLKAGFQKESETLELLEKSWQEEYKARLCGLGNAGFINAKEMEMKFFSSRCLSLKFQSSFYQTYDLTISQACRAIQDGDFKVAWRQQQKGKNSANWHYRLRKDL